jgi:hypothetical protein
MASIVEVNCSHRIAQGLLLPLSSSSFRPTSRSRRAVSASLSPDSASVSRARSTSSTSEVCYAPPSPHRLLSNRRVPPLLFRAEFRPPLCAPTSSATDGSSLVTCGRPSWRSLRKPCRAHPGRPAVIRFSGRVAVFCSSRIVPASAFGLCRSLALHLPTPNTGRKGIGTVPGTAVRRPGERGRVGVRDALRPTLRPPNPA